jgi:hypothetical protein
MTRKQVQFKLNKKAGNWVIESFLQSDTRRIGPEGEIFRYYIACDGQLKAKFATLQEAADWVEFGH